MTPPQFKTVPVDPTMGMYDDFLAAVANSSDPWFGGWADGWRAAVAAAPESAPTLAADVAAADRFVAEVFEFFAAAKIEADIDGDADDEGRPIVHANYRIVASFRSVQNLVDAWRGERNRHIPDDPLEELFKIIEGVLGEDK